MMFSAKIAMRCDGAAGEHVEHAEQRPGWHASKTLRVGIGIDARQRDIGAEAIDQQRAEGEPECAS